MNKLELLQKLHKDGKLVAIKLIDYQNKTYDIAQFMYIGLEKDGPFERTEMYPIWYVYGGDSYTSEMDAIADNVDILFDKLIEKGLEKGFLEWK